MPRGTRNRDKNIVDLIRQHKSHILMEIGVWRCVTSVAMIEAAAEQWSIEDVTYYGFDVFADISVNGDRSFWKREKSSVPWSHKHATSHLEQLGAKTHLFQGMTQETLPSFVNAMKPNIGPNSPQASIDFIWLDGGHTYETVANDWHHVRQLMRLHTVVLFDDYAVEWQNDKWGVNRVVDSIDRNIYSVDFLEPHDLYKCGKDEGKFCIVKVMLR